MAYLELHLELEEKFLNHQEELITLKLEKARRHLAEFAKTLRHHIFIEDKYILPLYERKVPPPPGGGAFLFYGEHEKIKEFLGKIEGKMKKLAPRKKNIRRQIIELLDVETRFKDILMHHDLREKNLLYPLLDKAVTPEERKMLLAL